MCDKAKTAVEVIKTQKRKTLSKEETLMLFQKVIEDNMKMGDRMTNLEKRMESLETKMDAGFAEIKKLIEKEHTPTFWERIPLLKDIPTWFWIILWTVVLIIGGLLGVSPEFIKHIQTGV